PGLRVRDQAVPGDAPPRGHLAPDAAALALLAEVRAPWPDGHDDVDRRALREQSHLAVAPEGDRPDVATRKPVAPDQLVRRVTEPVDGGPQLLVEQPGRTS